MLIESLIIGTLALGAVAFKLVQYRKGHAQDLLTFVEEAKNADPLHHRVIWVKYLENIGDYGRRTALIYETNNRLSVLLEKTLNTKFTIGELTYQRYFHIIELTCKQVRSAILNILPVLEGMDIGGDPTKASAKQIEMVLRDCQTLNGSLEQLLIELSKLSNFDQQQNSEVEELLKNIQDLTNRVKNYS